MSALLVAALAPAAVLLHFFWVRDKYDREPFGRVMLVFFVSLLSVIPAAILEMFFNFSQYGLIGVALTVWLGVALPEEVVKYLFLRWLAVGRRHFDEVYDGIVYGVAAALGFATTENLMYIFADGGNWVTAIMRAVLSVPGHALWGVMIGYHVGCAAFNPDPVAKRRLVMRGLLMAIFWHGLYDFFAFGSEIVSEGTALLFVLGLFAVIIINWVIGIRYVRLAQAQSSFKRPPPMLNPISAMNMRVKYCHNCGHPEPRENLYCTTCGYEFPPPHPAQPGSGPGRV
ncbi:PrsW family intramembrane metalloprotease [bacterium]|nr:PrsW family intramembrane metalloprotease [bacterium]